MYLNYKQIFFFLYVNPLLFNTGFCTTMKY